MGNELPGGARWLDIAPGRLPNWIASFGQRHGRLAIEGEQGSPAAMVAFSAADGSRAECHIPFPPLPADWAAIEVGAVDGAVGGAAAEQTAAVAARIVAHAMAQRVVGVLLVRLGGYAAGVFSGPDQRLVASKVGSRLVHGRSAAGGTSQHRFARRREKQASEALAAAAVTAAAVFGPYADRLDAVVLGGDKRAMAGLRDDPRLRRYFDLAVDRFLTVPDPRLAVLKSTPPMFGAIRIRLTEPAPAQPPAESRDAAGG
jgi:hypothetical protein